MTDFETELRLRIVRENKFLTESVCAERQPRAVQGVWLVSISLSLSLSPEPLRLHRAREQVSNRIGKPYLPQS